MASKNTKTVRPEIFIGGQGWQPVMCMSRGNPMENGYGSCIDLTIETPTYRFIPRIIMTVEERRITDICAPIEIEKICGTDSVTKRGNWIHVRNENLFPTSSGTTAIKLKSGEWSLRSVTVEELTSTERLEHQRTLNRDAWEEMGEKIGETLESVKRHATPPPNLKWWENLWNIFERQPDSMKENEKWAAVAHMVVAGADVESKKPRMEDRHSDYLTSRMLKGLIAELVTGSKAEIEKNWATNLRIYANREKKKSALAGKNG